MSSSNPRGGRSGRVEEARRTADGQGHRPAPGPAADPHQCLAADPLGPLSYPGRPTPARCGPRWLRSWPLLDPGREQVYDFSDARRAQLWPPGGGFDPAEVGPAVELL